MRVLVVGAGATVRDLLSGLSENWEVTVVDGDADRLEKAGLVRSIDDVRTMEPVEAARDRFVDADAVVAATSDDSVNLEVCRLAGEAGVERIAAIAADPERLSDYRDLKVAAVSPDRLAARRLGIQLEPRRVASAAFADGMAEVLEFRIAANSPVRGKSLQQLGSDVWLIVAILREGRLIIPHGASVLQAGDLVTVTGAAADYGRIVGTFTAGEATFPRDYGRLVAVAVSSEADLDGPVREGVYLAQNSTAEGLLLIGNPALLADDEDGSFVARVRGMGGSEVVEWAPSDRFAVRNIVAVASASDAGVLVVAAPSGGWFRVQASLSRLMHAARSARLPVLVSRGSHPYQEVVMAASEGSTAPVATTAAVDLAWSCGADLIGISAIPPPFMGRPDAASAIADTIARMREHAAVQGVTIHGRVEEGNPVRVIEKATGSDRILVMGMPRRRSTILTPGTVQHLARRAVSSVLIVPAVH